MGWGPFLTPGACFEWIYVKLHKTMLHTKYRSFGFLWFKRRFLHVFPIIKTRAANDAPGAGL